jgi:hypothetical protein
MALAACGGILSKQTKPAREFIPKSRWVEDLEMPDQPERAVSRQSFAVASGESVPIDAICLNEDLAMEYQEYRFGYELIHELYQSDRMVWAAHREAYESKLRIAEDRLQDELPSWWEKNDGPLMGIIGFVIGSAATVGVAVAAERALDD